MYIDKVGGFADFSFNNRRRFGYKTLFVFLS